MIAIGIGITAARLAVIGLSQPHHLRLGAVTHAKAMRIFEFIVNAAQIAAAIRRQKSAGVFPLLAVAEQGAEHARHALVPGKLHEGFGLRNANELGRFRAVAHIFAAAVQE